MSSAAWRKARTLHTGSLVSMSRLIATSVKRSLPGAGLSAGIARTRVIALRDALYSPHFDVPACVPSPPLTPSRGIAKNCMGVDCERYDRSTNADGFGARRIDGWI